MYIYADQYFCLLHTLQTTPEATTTTTSTTTSDGEDPDKPTLHDAIYSLSKCIHSSSHWNPQTYKAHWAKLVLILADKNDIMDLKVTKAEYAATVLGCPEVGGCYGSVCEEIDDAVSALGDEPIVSTKECIWYPVVVPHMYLIPFIIISKEGKEATRKFGRYYGL